MFFDFVAASIPIRVVILNPQGSVVDYLSSNSFRVSTRSPAVSR